MAFELLARRYSPFSGVGSNKGQNSYESGASELQSEDEPDGIAMTSKVRTINVKRRRAQVSEQASTTNRYVLSLTQSFASLTYLQKHLDSVIELAEVVDLNTPVTDALSVTLEQLNTPSSSSRPQPLRPYTLVEALSTLPSVRRLLQTREHQDAHELFLLLTNAISDELAKLDLERRKDKGLGEVLDFRKAVLQQLAYAKQGAIIEHNQMGRWRGKDKTRILSPWEGLSANRRICLKCGYCEGIRYETMGAMDVTLPSSFLKTQGFIPLEACLKHFTAIDIIDDAYCDQCTARLTLNFYLSEAERLAKPKDEGGKSSTARKKRAASARKLANRLSSLLETGDIANMEKMESLQDCKWLKATSRSARQSMIARPPQILALHLSRSGFTPYGELYKKTANVGFPLFLDITDFTTSGALHTKADGSISHHADKEWQEDTPRPEDAAPPRSIYRLDAVIFRDPATLPVKNWLRISDADVEEVSETEVLAERMAAFLLFYEKVGDKALEPPTPNHHAMSKGTIAEALSSLNESSGIRYRSNHVETRDAKL
ncbi:hypothetical protein QFC19_008168 [Naganishia cerealis]|uniref:Uncharacterized protein n=1 Tax=Naganishia cerealis TaxID=610337 RepID=A0ACC2V472_9TREE|nr:hypothetical protein QFC19_008168 [Naganishia cerealis]